MYVLSYDYKRQTASPHNPNPNPNQTARCDSSSLFTCYAVWVIGLLDGPASRNASAALASRRAIEVYKFGNFMWLFNGCK